MCSRHVAQYVKVFSGYVVPKWIWFLCYAVLCIGASRVMTEEPSK